MVNLNPCLMNELTFENLPKAVSELYNEVINIKHILTEKNATQCLDQDKWLDIKELCNYLPDKPSKVTVYTWVRDRTIPFHKGAKKLRFLKSEIDIWLKNGKKHSSTNPEIIPEHLLKTKRARK